MNDSSILFISAIVGIIAGGLIILAVIFAYLKGRKIGTIDLLVTLVGLLLVSLPVWQNVKFSLTPNQGGELTLNKLERKVENNRDTILDNNKTLNTQIADLTRKVEQLSSDVNALKQKNPEVQIPQEELDKRRQEEALFQENSKYSVFVFYRPDRREEADTIVQALSKTGYGSSKIATDLSEATVPQPKGTTAIIYTEKGKQKVQDVEKILQSLGLGNSINVEPQPRQKLGRGDINILLF